MPSFFTSFAVPALALALAGSALANPLKRDDACLAAVTGKAALGDENLRQFHCSSFIKTIVTPAAITVTTTITDAPAPITGKPKFKRDVTVCPNEVPNYASACDLAGYKSACKAYGISSETTYTIPATTTTKTVYAGKGGFGTCTDGTATVTSTVTIATGYGTGLTTYTNGNGFTSTYTDGSGFTTTLTNGNGFTFTTTLTNGNGFTLTGTGPVTTVTSTVTVAGSVSTVTVGDGKGNTTVTTTVTKDAVTVTAAAGSPAGPSGVGTCVTKERADALVAGFIDLLEYTNYAGNNYTTPPTPAGRGYHYNVSADIFDTNFFDVSDSINWMAGFDLGTVTFPSKAAFDYGQGVLQPEVKAEAIKVWYGCNTVTWRWLLTPLTGASVRGINHFVLNSDGNKILENYAEFDNAAWLASYGLQCKLSS